MHRLTSNFVLGFHGCDQKIADELLLGTQFRKSDNEYDWLGPGIYFWEANPKRGLAFAHEVSKLPRGPNIETPAVIGAVIDLGLCLDLTTQAGIEAVKTAHLEYVRIARKAGHPLPKNSPDLLSRPLDCAVIRLLHDIRLRTGDQAIDTVRGLFVEGKPIYEGAGFFEKTHSQIAVCNPDCIKGVFRVRDDFLIA